MLSNVISRQINLQSLPEESSSGELCARVVFPLRSKETKFLNSRRSLDDYLVVKAKA
ncbi:MAG: hypothetical protein AAF316_01430 [Cyanobacteria bacterium P01_A01_bin.80]